MKTTASELVGAIKEAEGKKTAGYDTTAEVRRITDGTAWVHIPGGVDETPVALTISAEVGDTVQIRVARGSAWITGNKSAPPTDDAVAIRARGVAIAAQNSADEAQEIAEGVEGIAQAAQQSANTAATAAAQAVLDAGKAKTSADNASEYAARALGNLSTVQSVAETLTWITQHGTMTLTSDVTPDPTHVYFVVDAGGDYRVGGTTYAIVTEPDVNDIGTYYELSIDESLNNYVGTHLALDSEGLWLLPASTGTNKVLIATGAGSTYTTAGTYLIDAAGEVMGKFTANSVQIGKNGEAQAEVTQYAFSATDKEGDAFFIAEDLRNEPGGVLTVTDTFISDGVTTNISLTYRATNTTYTVTVDGGDPPASMVKTQTQLVFGVVPQAGAVIVATYQTASQYAKAYTLGIRADNSVKGGMSVAEGEDCIASGRYSHAEGHGCTSTGAASHAEGISAQAIYNACHAEGANTQANDHGSHAEGLNTKALGYASHSQNYYTKAEYAYQTAIGKYNDNSSNNALEVGNGTADNARSNALTVKWNGDVEAAGDIEDGTGNVLSNKVDISSLAAVATSGEYADLINTPSIPTATSDLTNDSGFIAEDANGDISVTRNISAGGNVEAAGNITCGNHGSAIGYKTARQTGTYSLASGTTWVTVPAANLSRLTLGAGTWIIHAHAAFESNNTGRRSLQIYSITEGGELTRSTVNQTATNGSATNMQTSAIVVTSADTTYTVRVAQNSGSAKSVDLVLEAVRIA